MHKSPRTSARNVALEKNEKQFFFSFSRFFYVKWLPFYVVLLRSSPQMCVGGISCVGERPQLCRCVCVQMQLDWNVSEVKCVKKNEKKKVFQEKNLIFSMIR